VVAQRAGNLGSLTAQTKISSRLGFRVGSAADTKNVIYDIGWHKIADTNSLLYRLAYIS
jgi:hypothetical protein